MPKQLYDWRAHLNEKEAAKLARLESKRDASKVSMMDTMQAIHAIRAKAYQRARHYGTRVQP